MGGPRPNESRRRSDQTQTFRLLMSVASERAEMQHERGAMPEHDLIIGKTLNGRDFLCFGGGEHSVLHARSGAGKSVGFSIPNAFTWPGSLICLDIKRELFQHTAGYRASRGHSVIL